MRNFGRRLLLFFMSYATHVGGTVFAGQVNVPSQYGTIQSAVNAAQAGDTIVIAAGRYADMNTVTINRPLTLRGPNFNISPNTGTRVPEARVMGVTRFRLAANVCSVIIEGLSFESISGTGQGVIQSFPGVSNNIIIQRNRIVNTTQVSGVYSKNANGVGWIIRDNFISGIASPNGNSAFYLSDVDSVTVVDNVVNATSGDGIVFRKNHSITLLRNEIGGATLSGIHLDSVWDYLDIRNNRVTSCQTGLEITGSDLATLIIGITGNSFTGNTSLAIRNNATGILDASSNWLGATDPIAITSTLSGLIDYSPWLNNGSDTQTTTPGFQGDYSFLNVDANSPVAGGVTHLNEVWSWITPGGTVHLWPGDFAESIVVGISVSVLTTGTPRVQAAAFSNNANVSLFGDLEIYGNLMLESGTVNTDTSTIIVSNEDPFAVSISNGNIVGKIQRAIAAGSNAKYLFTDAKTSITPDGSQGSGYVLVESKPGMPPPVSLGNSINRHFMITPSSPLGGTVELSYLESELNSIPEEDLGAFNYNATTWYSNVGVVDTAQNMITVDSVSTWNLWTLGDMNSPLPIQLAHFSATAVQGTMNVSLLWGTVTETNNFGFLIQQREHSQSAFIDVQNSFVPGHGTTVNPQEYSWTHSGVTPGSYWYRLKQIDFDGTISFTEAREVILDAPTGVDDKEVPHVFALEQNYPNPFNPTTTIRFSVERTGYATVTLFNALGQEVRTLFSGDARAGQGYTLQVDASHLSSGVYFYRLASAGASALKRMLLLK